MNWDVWSQVEQILLQYNIKPILAVIPNNQDNNLFIQTPEKNFWNEVRIWQERGWTIGLHGYDHKYLTSNAGIIGLNNRSEFAGLSYIEQNMKISNALDIFKKERVKPETWIAPAHSFDVNTIAILRKHGIKNISDGYFIFPTVDAEGTFWLPQQLWRFRRLPFGVWTVCYHHNSWTVDDIENFFSDVKMFHNDIVDFAGITQIYKKNKHRLHNSFFSFFFLNFLLVRKLFKHG